MSHKSRARWKPRPDSGRIQYRLPGLDFRSKPYQDFSLRLDDQLTCLVQKWHSPTGAEPDCSERESASKCG
jgi:hypothetical protein